VAVRAPIAASTRTADPRLRGALLLPLCALVTHQLRYYLAFGDHTSARLAREGHGYLATLEPLALLATALAAGGFLGAVARATQHRPAHVGRRRSLRLWAACALALLAIYCGQELFEGFFAGGHPGGLAGIFGYGGWIAIPITLLIGALLALILTAADAVIRRIRRPVARPRRRARRAGRLPAAAAVSSWRLDPCSGLAPSRPPPLAAA
jgi:hypothetical protein